MPRKKLKSYTSSKIKRSGAGGGASIVKESPLSHPNDYFVLILADFERAVSRLRESLSQPYSETVRDSSLMRFEFTSELSWKVLRIYLKEDLKLKDVEGLNSPKGVFREAFKQGLIEDEPFWLETMDNRNLIVHTYKEEVAEKIYPTLPRVLSLCQDLLAVLKERKDD